MTRLRTHPGEVLREEFIAPLGLSARSLGAALGMPGNRIYDILRQRRDISADTASPTTIQGLRRALAKIKLLRETQGIRVRQKIHPSVAFAPFLTGRRCRTGG